VVTGDKLWTKGNARAELELGAATLWIDQETSFDFLKFDNHAAQMQLTQGSLFLTVHRSTAAKAGKSTPPPSRSW
jgi:hypothetical protein